MGTRVGDVSPRLAHPEAELWGLTHMNSRHWQGRLNDWTRWIDVHPFTPASFHPGIPNKLEYWRWLTSQDGRRPIYLRHAHQAVKGSVAFPRERLRASFGAQTAAHRFTTTLDWALAFAILEGFRRIILSGIGVNGHAQYQLGHQGILFWLGYAEGRGIEVTIEPPSCYLPATQDYGYDVGGPAPMPFLPPRVPRHHGYMKVRRNLPLRTHTRAHAVGGVA